MTARQQIYEAAWRAHYDLPTSWCDYLVDDLGIGTFVHYGPLGRIGAFITMPVRVHRQILDIAAWPFDAPEEFRILYDETAILGVEAFGPALIDRVPLRVCQTPWSWLKETTSEPLGCPDEAPPGVVILDDTELGAWRLVSEFPLIADNKEHGIELQRLIRASGRHPPRISYPCGSEEGFAA